MGERVSHKKFPGSLLTIFPNKQIWEFDSRGGEMFLVFKASNISLSPGVEQVIQILRGREEGKREIEEFPNLGREGTL